MLNNRRRFLKTGGLVATAFALCPLQILATEFKETVAAREVSTIISRYGNCIGNRQTHPRNIEFRVKVSSFNQFAKVFDPHKPLPFKRIYVGPGNTLKFNHLGTHFTILHLA